LRAFNAQSARLQSNYRPCPLRQGSMFGVANLLTYIWNVHFAAFLVGASLYVAYSLITGARLPRPSVGESKEDEARSRSRSSKKGGAREKYTGSSVAAFIAIVAVVAVSYFWLGARHSCPAELSTMYSEGADATPPATTSAITSSSLLWMTDEVSNSSDFFRPSVPRVPSSLLKHAWALGTSSQAGTPAGAVLEACAEWTPPGSGDTEAPVGELQAQLSCHRELLEPALADSAAAAAKIAPLLSKSKSLFEALRVAAPGAWDILADSAMDWAHIASAAFQSRCTAAWEELRALRNGKAIPVPESLSVLRSLSRLESVMRQALAALRDGIWAWRTWTEKTENPRAAAHGGKQIEELHELRGKVRSCTIRAIQEARAVVLALPQSHELVRNAVRCHPKLLADLEALALQEAEQETYAGAQFNLGLYWSEIGVSGDVPFFGQRASESWGSDADGLYIPLDLARAEGLMLLGEEASDDTELAERGPVRALRLYHHAKRLALQHHDAAAEVRYRTAAKVAALHQRHKLAGHSLTRLSYFLSLRGWQAEALSTANEALDFTPDPLALYLQATLRCSLGYVKEEAEILEVESQLMQIAGKLPSQALEEKRYTAHRELRIWRAAAEGGLETCFALQDASRVLACLICKFLFNT